MISVESTELNAKRIIINPDSATFKGTDFIALILEDNTEEGAKFGPSIGISHYSQRSVSNSGLSSSDVGCEGWYEVMVPCRFMINQLIRTIDEGEIKLESVNWDKDRTQIIGKFAETTYELKKNHTQWAIHEQIIPDEALIVVALGISLATYGTGGSLFATAVTNMTGGTMIATGTGMAMASAGFTTLCSQAATSFLRTGDPIATARELYSDRSLKSLGISIASAGLTHKIGTGLGLQLNPKEMGFMDYVRKNSLEFAIKAPLNSIIGRQSVSESLREGGKSFVIDTIAQYACNQIGKLYLKGQEGKPGGFTYGEQKLLHFGVGAGSGALFNSKNPLRGALSGGMGAVLSEVLAEQFVDPKVIKHEIRQEAQQNGKVLSSEESDKRFEEVLKYRTNLVRFTTASLVAIAGFDSTISILTTNNALDNNFIPSTMKATHDPEKWVVDEEDEEFIDYLTVSGLSDDALRGIENLYYQLTKEGAIEPQHPTYLRNQEKRIDQEIKAVNKELKNPHLTQWDRFQLENCRQALEKARHQTRIASSLIGIAGNERMSLKRGKENHGRQIHHWTEVSHRITKDTNVPRLGVGSVLMGVSMEDHWEMYASQMPVKDGELALTALTVVPTIKVGWSMTQSTVKKAIQFFKPKPTPKLTRETQLATLGAELSKLTESTGQLIIKGATNQVDSHTAKSLVELQKS